MSLTTRCPVCGTAFRVQRAQLAARGGKVRCGKCGEVFNGIAGLVEEGAEPFILEPSPQLGLFDPSRRLPAPPPKTANDAPPAFMAEDEPVGRRLLWGLLVLTAAVALAGQIAYRYRTEIAAFMPSAAAPLDAACRLLRCQVPLPRRPELMSIESSDLQAEPRRDGVIVLNAVLRNRAPFAQDYPALELTLTDEADRPVLRRVLAPREYLDPVRGAPGVAQGIPAGAEVSLRIYLDAGRRRATGYRLYLFYPS
jgi:predicted Zn finger-like uncharacterized protein